MAYKMINDIVEFVKQYYENNGRKELVEEEELAKFVEKLETEIGKMEFSVSEGTTVIAYTGTHNGIPSHKVAKQVSQSLGNSATYNSDLDAGKLLINEKFQVALENLIILIVNLSTD